MNVAPVIGRVAITLPLIREADASGEADFPVHDEDAAVAASVDPIKTPGVRRMKIGDGAATFFHQVDIGVVELRAGPDSVEKDAHLHPGFRALDECIAE